MDLIVFIGLALVCLATLAVWRERQRRRSTAPALCDIRRSIILVGPEQNDVDCVDQRRALKPLLMRLRQAGINVIEIYGQGQPRRNGRALDWIDNEAMRRALRCHSGFHLVCLDDEAETIVHGRRPVSQAVLSELIAGEERAALPAPSDGEKAAPGEPPDSWGSVGVLR